MKHLRYPTISYISFLHLTSDNKSLRKVAIAHIHIGTNQGDLIANLRLAVKMLEGKGSVLDTSHIYETQAWGKKDQPNFYNMALTYEMALEPYDLLQWVNEVEDQLGRKRNEKWGERIIDLDIITYGNKIIYDEKLKIPHEHMTKRNFVLVPMMEIAGEWVHPKEEKTIEELYMECRDTCEVILIEERI